MTPLAIYTTVYPGVEKYLADWYRSLRGQTDRNSQLWIGLDTIGIEETKEAMGGDPGAIWVPAAKGDSPALVRQRALAQIIESHDAVVLVDSDDIMHPTRVATARALLRTTDLVGCALRLVDERGSSMDVTLTLPPNIAAEDVFPRNNVFGLSNTALRSDLLRRCLPIPGPVALVDWFLATRAWLLGARLAFGEKVEMDYRQHDANTARVLGPFDEQQLVSDTERVREHFRILQIYPAEGAIPHRRAEAARAAAEVEAFYQRVILQPTPLERYLRALNKLDATPMWWSCVANPLLQHMWTPEEEVA